MLHETIGPTCKRLLYQHSDLCETAVEELCRSVRVEYATSQSFKIHAEAMRPRRWRIPIYLHPFILLPDCLVMILKDSGASLDIDGDDAFQLIEQSKTSQTSTLSSANNG